MNPAWSLTPALLAHQGGWDEILLVVAPLVGIAGLLVIANRRVAEKLKETSQGDSPEQDLH